MRKGEVGIRGHFCAYENMGSVEKQHRKMCSGPGAAVVVMSVLTRAQNGQTDSVWSALMQAARIMK